MLDFVAAAFGRILRFERGEVRAPEGSRYETEGDWRGQSRVLWIVVDRRLRVRDCS